MRDCNARQSDNWSWSSRQQGSLELASLLRKSVLEAGGREGGVVTRATFLTTCYVPPSPHVRSRTQKTDQRPHQIFINLRPSRLIMSMSFVSFLVSSLETLPAGGLPSL